MGTDRHNKSSPSPIETAPKRAGNERMASPSISIPNIHSCGGEEFLEHKINVGALHENPVSETCNLKSDG